MLRARTSSGFLIVIGTLLVTVLGGWPFFLVALIVALAGLDELMRMLSKAGHRPARALGAVLTLLFFTVAQVGGNARWLGLVLTLAIVAPLLAVMLRDSLTGTMLDWSTSLAATLYLGWLAAHAVLLRSLTAAPPSGVESFWSTDLPGLLAGRLPVGLLWTLTAILTTWATDTAAFFAGRAWGRTHLMPRLSPNKTREGAIGGLLAGTATTVACLLVFGLVPSWPVAVLAGLLLSSLAQIGDLAESLLKRQTGVKDAGQAIPGHGGVLDRIDSLLFTLPATYYLATFLG